MKISIALLISLLFISTLSYSQTDREWWDNLSPAWKQVFQKQELKGKDIDPNDQQLERLVNITHIDCSGNQDIKTLKPLSRLQYLEELRCEGTNVESLEGVENLRSLKVIDCSDNDNIDDLTPLMMVETLVELDCSNTMVKNLEPLSGLQNLRILDLHFCTVNKILQLKELRKLEVLDVSENPLYDIFGIKRMQGLIELNLSQTKIRNLSELSYLTNLQILNISKTSVGSLRDLQDVKTLTELPVPASTSSSDQITEAISFISVVVMLAVAKIVLPSVEEHS